MERKRNRDSPEPGPSSRITSDTMDNKKVKRKRIQESKDASVIDGDLQQQNEPGPGPDWRQLPEVIEEICKHLPSEDIKSVRLVCKVWSEAGAVPLSYKSIYSFNGFKKDYRTSFFEARSCLTQLENKKLSPGFGLRNLELDWFIEKNYFSITPPGPGKRATPPEPRLEIWLYFFKSKLVRDVVSLKLRNFPYRVIDEVLLTQCFFPKLKTLELHSVRYSAPVLIPAEALGGSCDNLELKSVGIFNWMPHQHGWKFLKNCHRLTVLTIHITEGYDANANNDALYRCHMEKLTNDLKRKTLTSLDLEFSPANSRNLSVWSTFCNQLISCNRRLERLRLAVYGYHVSVSGCFDEVPLPPRNLKTFECIFSAYHQFVDNRRSQIASFEELFKKFESKGYLKVENFHLSNGERSPSLRVSCVKGKLSMIMSPNLKFSRSFLDTMRKLFPEVNYVCSPRQNKVGNQSPITTALLERLGKDGVFNLEAITAVWDTIKPSKSSRLHRQDLFELYSLVVHDPEVISSNLISNRFDWKLGEHVKEYKGILYLFDTIPDMHEAWAKVQNSTSYWSSVPDGFVPAVVNYERASAYSFCRMFKEVQDIRPPARTILTRSKASAVEIVTVDDDLSLQ